MRTLTVGWGGGRERERECVGRKFAHSSFVVFFFQPSKRSALELCGRNDGNIRVIFPDVEMEDGPRLGSVVRAQPGDYVLVQVICPLGTIFPIS